MHDKSLLCFWIGLCLLVSLYGCAVPEPMPETGGSDSNGSAEWMATESSELPDLASTVVDGAFLRSPMTDSCSWDLDGGAPYTGLYVLAPFDDGYPIMLGNVVEEMDRYLMGEGARWDLLYPAILFVAKTDLPASDCPPDFWPPIASAEAYKLRVPSEAGRTEWEALLASWGIVKGKHYSPTTEVPPYFEQQPRKSKLWDVSLFDFYQIDLSLRDMLQLCWRACQEGYLVFFHFPSTRSMEAMRLDRLGW